MHSWWYLDNLLLGLPYLEPIDKEKWRKRQHVFVISQGFKLGSWLAKSSVGEEDDGEKVDPAAIEALKAWRL